MRYLTLLVSLFACLGCHPKPPFVAPKPPTPSALLGVNPWRLNSDIVRMAIAPSGSLLAVVDNHRFKVIDLLRDVVSYKGAHDLGDPSQITFLDHERALLIIGKNSKNAEIYPLAGGEPETLGTFDFAEADSKGERVLLRIEGSRAVTCLAKQKDLSSRRKIFWDCRDGYATFLPSGDVIRSGKGRLERNNQILPTEFIKTGHIWSDPTGEQIYILSSQTSDSKYILQVVELATNQLTTRELPALFSFEIFQEPPRNSLLLWLSLCKPWFFDGEMVSWLQFYDVTTGEARVLLDHPVPYQDAVVSPTGEHLFVASQYNITKYRLSTQKVDNEVQGHTRPIQELTFSDEDQLLLSRDENRIIAWDLSTYQMKFELKANSYSMALQGDYLVVSTTDEQLFAVSLSTGRELWRSSTKYMVPGGAPLRRLMPKNDREMTAWADSFAGRPTPVTISLSSGAARVVAVPSALDDVSKGFQRSWKTSSLDKVVWISSGEQISITDKSGTHTATQKIPAKQFSWLLHDRIVAAFTGQRIALLDAQTARVVGITGPQSCQDELCEIIVSPKERVASITDRNTTRLWDVSTQKLLWEQRGATASAFSSDGSVLAVAKENGEIALYPVAHP